MTLPQNGLPISLKQIADEFGDAAPHSLSEFYGQGGVTSSGIIDFDDFYGKSRAFIFNKTISSNTQEYNLRTDLLANGWDGVLSVDAQITVNSGVYVWSNSTSTAAFTTGSLVADSVISIINNGYIMGKGGNGGSGTGIYSASSGSSAGPAMNINYPVSITNNSYIGGGGGAGGASGGSGAWMTNSSRPAGGSGGAPGAKGSNGAQYAGGGGGRIMPGVRTTAYSQGGGAGGAGARDFGSSSSYGYGGAGGEAGGSEVNDGSLPRNSGGGGGWGSSGGTGYPGVGGGAGGKCINLNGNTVTWVATGTRYGAIS